jgi:osmotically-inducible protein OsmY
MSETRNNRLYAIRRPLARVMLCTMLAVSLQGCFELALGTAVVGSLAAVDRRTLGVQTDDKTNPIKVASYLRENLAEGHRINVNSFNRKVLLTGEVKDEAMKQEAQRLAAAVAGVEAVYNELTVDFVAGLGTRAYDTLLTTKVKASLIDAKDLQSNAIKVVSERDVVYLMGLVTEREGARAAEIAAGVGGVAKVVKLFDVISEEQLAGMASSPAAGESAQQRPVENSQPASGM